MSTNQNQQINVFTKGMNTDTSDAYLSNEQYRYAENLRFITNTGENSGELRLIEGYKEKYRGEDKEYFKANEYIIAATTVRDLLVMLTRYTDDTDNCAIVVINSLNGDVYRPFVAKDAHWGGSHYSLVTRWEDNDNIKLYVADGVNPLRVFRIDKHADNEPWSSSFDDIDKTGSVVFGGFYSIEKIEGYLKPGMVQYAYQMYDRYGKTSHVSPLSEPIKIHNADEGVLLETDGNANTRMGLRITIRETSENYEKIKLYRIYYLYTGLAPIIELIADLELSEADVYVFEDKGQTVLAEETFAEFLSKNYLQVAPQYIESKGDYLFAANNRYEYAPEFAELYNAYDATAQPNSTEYSLSFDKRNNWDYFLDNWYVGKKIQWKFETRAVELTEKPENSGRSLQRDEIYRYGIIFYDMYGNKWPVKWIADVRVPQTDIIKIESYKIKKIQYGMKFFVDADRKFIDAFPAYEIVRCPRTSADRHIISLGIVGKAIHNTIEKYTKTFYPSGFFTMGNLISTTYGESTDSEYYTRVSTANGGEDSVLMFASPEICYNETFVLNNVTSASSLKYMYRYATNVSNITSLFYDRDNGYYERFLYQIRDEPNYNRRLDFIPIRNIDAVRGIYRYGNKGQAFFIRTDGSIEISGGNYIKLHPRFRKEDEATGSINELETTKNYQNFTEDSKGAYEGTYPSFNYIDVTEPKAFASYSYFKVNLNNVEYVSSPQWNEFYNTDFEYKNSTTTVGNLNFVNWSAAMITPFVEGSHKSELVEYYHKEGSTTGVLTDSRNHDGSYTFNNETLWRNEGWRYSQKDWAFRYPMGSGGKCMIIATNNSDNLTGDATDVVVANIVNDNIVPYGGFSEYRRTNSIYQGYGNYFKGYRYEQIVFDGDCDIQWFYYNALHTWYSPNIRFAPKMGTVYRVPVETIVDINMDSGDSYKRLTNENIQDKAVNGFKNYIQEKDAYMYNTAYSTEPTVQPASGLDEEDIENNNFDYRIMYSNPKTNNEPQDSWLNFLSSNYIDVDTRYGEITNLRLFRNSLVFWQKDAVGVLSVDERTILLDINDTNIILGNSGVLQRYDYLSTKHGMAATQMCDAQSDTVLYWWDDYNRDIVMYTGGQTVQPMKIAKTVSNLINKSTIEYPVLAYDNKYKEVLLSTIKNDDEDLSLVYNEYIQQFTSMYNVPFKLKASVGESVFLIADDDTCSHVYKWNEDGNHKLPLLRYVVNDKNSFTKVYDNVLIGMGESFYYREFYNGNDEDDYNNTQPLTFKFNTIEQETKLTKNITNREFDLRFAIPRANDAQYCERMRGRTMQCELTSSSSSTDFSIQYIITKYRISWS